MSLAPALLLSMPQLIDPNFARTVVLLCEHAPEGAFGLVVNRPSEVVGRGGREAGTAGRARERPAAAHRRAGGAAARLDPHRRRRPRASRRGLGAGLYLSASPVLLRRVLTARPLPRRTHVLAGYAGWGPGQLDAELAESAWLIMPVELDLIFEIPAAGAWEMAIRRLGADPHLLQMGHGVH